MLFVIVLVLMVVPRILKGITNMIENTIHVTYYTCESALSSLFTPLVFDFLRILFHVGMGSLLKG